MKAIPVFSLNAVKGLIITKFTDDKIPVKSDNREALKRAVLLLSDNAIPDNVRCNQSI